MTIVKRATCLLLSVMLCAMASASVAVAQKVVPIIDTGGGCLLGGTLDGKWVDAEKIAPLMQGGETYTVYGLMRKMGTRTGSKPASEGPPCNDTLYVKPSEKVDDASEIAIGGAWNALPRVPKVEGTNSPVYRAAVAAVLRKNGIRRPEVKIVKVLRIDLEGDGVEEVLISATRVERWGSGSIANRFRAGDYSFVLLRKVIRGRVENIVIEGEFHPKAVDDMVPNEYSISAALDLNGDGRMEVVLAGGYYEGDWKTVYTIEGSKTKGVISCGCGA